MSGIGFQKLQGQGTSAYEQLQKTSEVLEKLQEMRFPDIRKLAIEFYPDIELIPVTKSWNLRSYSPNNVNPKIENLQFDGLYFGYFTVSLTSILHVDNPGLRELSELALFNGLDALTKISVVKHGNDEAPYSVSPVQVIGVADRMCLYSITSDSYGIVSFIGYKIGEPLEVENPEPEPEPIPIPVPPDVNIQIEIKSRPNGIQPFKAVFGALNIIQHNGLINYNQVTTSLVLNGFDGLPFSYKYYLDGVLTSQGVTLMTETIDVYHSHTHRLEIDYVMPVMSAKYMVKHIHGPCTHKLVYDDNQYNLASSYFLINHPTTTLSVLKATVAEPITTLFRVRSNVLTAIGLIPSAVLPLSNGDKFFAVSTSGDILNVLNFSAGSINILNNAVSFNLASNLPYSKLSAVTTKITNNGAATVNLAVLTNLTITYHTVLAGNFIDLPHSGTASTAVTVVVY